MKPSLLSVGEIYKDFEVTKVLKLEELQSLLLQFVHLPTGASVIHIANDDPENVFCLSFQTLPDSSNGVAHILEHTVLCGSKKFPVKDPFFSMTRRSLNTYMNALTGQDFTCYPASSQVEKDFYNLLEIYLDAVFQPELKYLSFLQEGHRLEWTDQTLQFQGVVYNEMKGVMASSDSRLWEALATHLTPDLPYAHNSGGNPKEIPSLTYEELLSFHKNFYHPSRCLFFFYGNLSLEKHLDFITKHALEGVQKIAPIPPLPLQKRYETPIIAKAPYPIAADEPKEKKAEIAFAWLTVPIGDQQKTLALCLLDLILLDNDASFLKMSLLKSGLCSQVEASMDLEMSEIPWVIVCKGCDPEDGEKLKKCLFDTLEEICKLPFPSDMIEASLHQLEFDRTEIGGEGLPFGLTLFFRAALLHQQGSEPENALLIHTLFSQLKERLKDPQYLTHLLREQMVENPHFVQFTLYPDANLEKNEAEEEQKRLQIIQKKLSKAEIENIHKEAKQLFEYQEKTEHQSLDCLPKLQLSDVPPKARDFLLFHQETDSFDLFHHDCFTNQILYADLLFDLPDIAADDLPLVALFSRLVTEVGSGGRNYQQTLAYQQAYTGSLEAILSQHVQQNDSNQCRPSFSIRGKALYRNAHKLFSLFHDMRISSDFSDLSRIRELLSQQATQLRSKLTKNAMNYATQMALCSYSPPSFINNQWNGLPYYEAALKWSETKDASLLENLDRIQKEIFSSSKPHLILSCDQKAFQSLHDQSFFGFADCFRPTKKNSWKGTYPLPESNSQIRLITSPVAFTALGMHTVNYAHKDAPLLLLATELIENCFLHTEIREKGGAYGSGASYSPSSGNFHLYAYRDPHLTRTIATFHQAIEKIAHKKFNEQELIEAKFGVLQTLDAPVPPGNRGIVAYAWARAGRTYPLRQAFREKILSSNRNEVAKAVEKHLLPQKKTLVSFLGKELYEREREKLQIPATLLPIAL